MYPLTDTLPFYLYLFLRGGLRLKTYFWHILRVANASGDNSFGSYFASHYPSDKMLSYRREPRCRVRYSFCQK